MLPKRRFPTQIMRDVLEAADAGASMQAIRSDAGISSATLDRYLGFLARRGYVRRDNGSVKLTRTGQSLLRDLVRATRHLQ